MLLRIFLLIAFASIGCQIFDGISSTGNSGVATTRLPDYINSTATTLIVDSTNGFPDYGIIKIDDEYMSYSNTEYVSGNTGQMQFTGVTRGIDNTNPSSHDGGSTIYSEGAAGLNDAMSFNVVKVTSNFGIFSIPSMVTGFLFGTLPKMLMWNYSFLNNPFMAYIKIFLSAFSMCATIYFAIMFIQAFGNIMQSALRIPGRLFG